MPSPPHVWKPPVHVWFGGHGGGEQEPSEHKPLGQTLPHKPQFRGSVSTSAVQVGDGGDEVVDVVLPAIDVVLVIVVVVLMVKFWNYVMVS